MCIYLTSYEDCTRYKQHVHMTAGECVDQHAHYSDDMGPIGMWICITEHDIKYRCAACHGQCGIVACGRGTPVPDWAVDYIQDGEIGISRPDGWF